MPVWNRIKEEIGYWRQSDWTFADIGAHYDRMGHEYDEINEGAHSYFRRFTDTLRLADLPDQGHFLDVPARTGNGTAFFYRQGKVKTAVCADVSIKMGQICQKRLQAAGLESFRWQHITSYDWPFDDGEFDSVLSLESVEHFSQPERFVQELSRVTRPGGKMILSTPNVLWEPVHALAAVTGLHHSEGPHRFIRYRRLLHMVEAAGFHIDHAETTVLVPAGPEWLIRMGEWVEAHTKETLMPLLGLRRILICQKV